MSVYPVAIQTRTSCPDGSVIMVAAVKRQEHAPAYQIQNHCQPEPGAASQPGFRSFTSSKMKLATAHSQALFLCGPLPRLAHQHLLHKPAREEIPATLGRPSKADAIPSKPCAIDIFATGPDRNAGRPMPPSLQHQASPEQFLLSAPQASVGLLLPCLANQSCENSRDAPCLSHKNEEQNLHIKL